MKPISPKEIDKKKQDTIPDEIIEIFNDMIVEKWNNKGSATILQDEVVARIVKKLKIKRDKIFENHYLDIESIFTNAGWIVDYDQPAYCESYPASFKFSKKS